MKFQILTLFPEPLRGLVEFSILKRAIERGILELDLVDIRSFALDRHRTTDDSPYGGGVGMLMKLEPLSAALQSCLPPGADDGPAPRVVLLSPSGRRLDQPLLEDLARADRVILVCGRYEGLDDRFRTLYVTDEISAGDFVITGGELAAAIIVDGVVRLLPGVLGKDESSHDESFTSGLLEYPQFTRPAVFQGLAVPAVLVGGNHVEVARWRNRQALLRTAARRPDLLPADWRDRLNPPRKLKRNRRRKHTPALDP
jgi:tRNA (guanine37-N1)-methyltransferase